MRNSSSSLLAHLIDSLLSRARNKSGIARELNLTKWDLSRWTSGGGLPPRRRVARIAQRLCELDCHRDQVAQWVRAVHDELNEQAARKNGYGFFLDRPDRATRTTSRRVPR